MSILHGRENKTPPGGVCHDLWGAEFIGSPCHNRQVIIFETKNNMAFFHLINQK